MVNTVEVGGVEPSNKETKRRIVGIREGNLFFRLFEARSESCAEELGLGDEKVFIDVECFSLFSGGNSDDIGFSLWPVLIRPELLHRWKQSYLVRALPVLLGFMIVGWFLMS